MLSRTSQVHSTTTTSLSFHKVCYLVLVGLGTFFVANEIVLQKETSFWEFAFPSRGSESSLLINLATSSSSIIKRKRKKEVVFGFVRIPKTGSSSLLKFLRAPDTGLTSWDNYINDVASYQNEFTPARRTHDSHAPFCIFAGNSSSGSSSSNIRNQPKSTTNEQNQLHDGRNLFNYTNPSNLFNMCPHTRNNELIQNWKLSLNHVDGSDDYGREHDDDEDLMRMVGRWELQSFTIIRDPYERLQSLYYYVQKFCDSTQAWKDVFRKPRYKTICNKRRERSFDDFMAHIYDHGTRFRGLVYHQHMYFHNDVDQAIEMITTTTTTTNTKKRTPQRQLHGVDQEKERNEGREKKDPEVLVLIHECFEDSLRLLEAKFSLKVNATRAFVGNANDQDKVDDGNFHSNVNKYERRPILQESREQQKLARRHLKKDYKFYNAALQEFQHQLIKWESKLSEPITQKCLSFLESSHFLTQKEMK